MTIDKSHDDADDNCKHDDVDDLAVFHDEFPILFEIFPDKGEKGIPESCTDDGIDDEFGHIHLPHTCRQRNQMPDNRDKPTDKNSDMSFFFEEMFGRC